MYKNVNRFVAVLCHRITGHPAGRFPPARRFYLVNEKYRFILAYIPKVASGSLTVWFLNTLGHRDVSVGSYRYARDRYGLLRYSPSVAKRIWKDYFKISFVRNPYNRLISAYVSIFIRSVPRGSISTFDRIAKPVIASVYNLRDEKANFEKGITFNEFVEWVCLHTKDKKCNPHWRSQSWFTNPDILDFIGKFERFNSDFKILQDRLGFSETPTIRHKTPKSDKTHMGSFAHVYVKDLRGMLSVPPYETFYNIESRKLVAERYKVDFVLFCYHMSL